MSGGQSAFALSFNPDRNIIGPRIAYLSFFYRFFIACFFACDDSYK